MAPVPVSTGARKSPVGKNRMLVTATPAPAEEPVVAEQPNMGRLTAVLAVCFALGVAWPIAARLDFVQRPPGSNNAPAKTGGETESDGPSEGEAGPSPSAAVPAMRAAPLEMSGAVPHVDNRIVQSCEGNAGEAIARCDAPALDGVLERPLAKLAACGRARGVSGVLSLGMRVNFSRGQIDEVEPGQSTTLSEEQTTTLIACAEESVVGAPLEGVAHAHPRYWVYYVLRFDAPGADAETTSVSDVVSASGHATVGWKTAIVRESPSTQATIASHLAYGTRVSVTGRAGDWYRIERSGKALGWVHRDALGL